MDRLLLIDDEADVRYSFGRILDSPDIELAAAESGEEGLRLLPQFKPDVVIMDIRMGGMSGLETLRQIRQADPKLPVIMMTAYGTTQTAIEAMKLGAYDYLLKPFDVPRLQEIVRAALKAARDMRQMVAVQPALDAEDVALGIVGRSEAMQAVFKLIGQLARSDPTVLVTGESGTGKELVARAIYHHSQRSRQPYLAINCAAIPEHLLESELFGHEKGAFTGAAAQRIGKFEQCHRGTLFLDEIGDMSLATQTKILRVLQTGAFDRVGGNQPVQVDVRIIAATHQPLEQAIAARRFREDLFYRLNVVRIHLPPLRDRLDDLPLLAEYFLRKLASGRRQPPLALAASSLDLLQKYSWPGNIRELENAIRRALVVARGDTILPADLPPEILEAARATPAGSMGPPSRSPATPPPSGAEPDWDAVAERLFDWAQNNPQARILPTVERALIRAALRHTRWNQVQAARLLGITRATLRKRIQKFQIVRGPPSD
ncbi:MAG TPA: sigma-54 dependent transcriptional regulator [Candidatus Paceibacterota bacterium]|nr:sigma-54 dependent transcriptional regulator [Verrucomicrobiota bacterium]HRZ47595.1 sigma-54 dependent transcriptional regulator [Candidatus Paceibacterota bacterium]